MKSVQLILTLVAVAVLGNDMVTSDCELVPHTKSITMPSGTHINITSTICKEDEDINISKRGAHLEIGGLVRKDASECTTNNCVCGTGCPSLSCTNPPSSISSADCITLKNDLVALGGSTGPMTGLAAVQGTCVFLFTPLKGAVEYCFNDMGNLGQAMNVVCPGSQAVCTDNSRFSLEVTS